MRVRQGRRRKQLLDELKETRGYWKLKEKQRGDLALEEAVDLALEEAVDLALEEAVDLALVEAVDLSQVILRNLFIYLFSLMVSCLLTL